MVEYKVKTFVNLEDNKDIIEDLYFAINIEDDKDFVDIVNLVDDILNNIPDTDDISEFLKAISDI